MPTNRVAVRARVMSKRAAETDQLAAGEPDHGKLHAVGTHAGVALERLLAHLRRVRLTGRADIGRELQILVPARQGLRVVAAHQRQPGLIPPEQKRPLCRCGRFVL
jgi:hypothetical protein